MTASLIFGLDTRSSACQAIRQSAQFISALTHVAGSLSILALTVERYITCIYCLRAYAILTSKRVKIALIGIWSVSLLCGGLALEPNLQNQTPLAMGRNRRLGFLTVCTTFPVSVILIIVQVRLYLVSKAKLREDARVAKFGQNAEASDIRKRQWKTTLVSAVVAAMYVICMVPLSCWALFNFIDGRELNAELLRVRSLIQMLTSMNTLADPFVYGYGMPDTRRMLKSYYRTVKNQIFERFNIDIELRGNKVAVVSGSRHDTRTQTTSL